MVSLVQPEAENWKEKSFSESRERINAAKNNFVSVNPEFYTRNVVLIKVRSRTSPPMSWSAATGGAMIILDEMCQFENALLNVGIKNDKHDNELGDKDNKNFITSFSQIQQIINCSSSIIPKQSEDRNQKFREYSMGRN